MSIQLPDPSTPEKPEGRFAGEVRVLRNRVLTGLLVVLPFFITYAVVQWLYLVLYNYALRPIAAVLNAAILKEYSLGDENLPLSATVVTSILAFFVVLAILYVAGIFARTRLHRLVDWVMMTVPGVSTIYRVVSKVFNAISASQSSPEFKRVVLIEFPHPGIKVPGFVTSECQDTNSGQTILCVYVPTTPVPTSGYMLMVPESEVVPLTWNLEETLQAIVSGGITVPKQVTYFKKPIAE